MRRLSLRICGRPPSWWLQARSIVESSPTLARMVASATEDEIRFTNRTALAAFPCSSRGGRGWAVSCLVMDEAAFFYSETDGPQAADEVWRALSPSSTQFGDAGRIIVASTPNGPSGFFYDLYTRAQAGSLPEARAHHAATSEVNPAIAAAFLASEAARDPMVTAASLRRSSWRVAGASLM